MWKLSCKECRFLSKIPRLLQQARNSRGSTHHRGRFRLCSLYPRGIKPCPSSFSSLSVSLLPSHWHISLYLDQHNSAVDLYCVMPGMLFIGFLITELPISSLSHLQLTLNKTAISFFLFRRSHETDMTKAMF